MAFQPVFRRVRFSGRAGILWFSLFWILGLIAGIFLANVYAFKSADLFRITISQSAPPVLIILVSVVPVGLISFSLWHPRLALRYIVIAFEAVCRGFCSMLIRHSFLSGAGIVCFLFLFSSICTSVILWWLVLRHWSAPGSCFAKDLSICFILSMIILFIDILVISPFLSDLSKYI